MDMLGYHNISYLINASIYLVKGGRLDLMPGVLFHSYRPSFRHTGVIFLHFAFLTRLGYNGPNLPFFPWVSGARGSSLFTPRASAPPSVGPN